MTSNEPDLEWQRLHALYLGMGDEELLELRATFDDLTDVAQGVLRDELRRRELWDRPTPAPVDSQPPGSNTWSAEDLIRGGVSVCECDIPEDADLFCYVLDRAGIPSAVLRSTGRFDLRLPQVRVAPDDLERARMVLANPISDDLRRSFLAESSVPDFEAPHCRRCSSLDVLLEAVEPTNQWFCETCGARWQDDLPEAANHA